MKNAEESIGETEKKIKKFNENNNKGFSETNESMKDLFSLFKSTSIGSLFPELQKPFNNLIKDIKLCEKIYKNLSKPKDTDKKEKKNTAIKETIKQNNYHNKSKDENKKLEENEKNNESSFLEYFIKDILNAKKNLSNLRKSSKEELKGIENATEELANNGGKSILGFSLKSVSHFALISASIIALLALTKKLISSLMDLGQEDIGHEKLARQLWTTKENARDIDSALKTLGVTMQDLWLSPTLLKQFNQLREDSSKLRLPPEFQDNIKVIQGLSLEFKRLKQIGSLAFKWIGNYILKYCAGPLLSIKKGLNKFNNELLKIIPHIAKIIGSSIGIILRIILMIGNVVGRIFSVISKGISFILSLIDKVPEPIKKIIKLIGVIAALIMTGPIGAIMLIIAALDDFFTFLRGGESVIGSVFGFFKEKGLNAISSVCDKFSNLKDKFKDGMSAIKDDWNSYWDKASETLDRLKEKAQKVWGDIKEWSKGIWDKTKDFAGDIGDKIFKFESSNANSVPASYLNNKTTNANNTTNNEINNDTVIKVYGSEAKSTANEVHRKFTGIQTRNVQGVY